MSAAVSTSAAEVAKQIESVLQPHQSYKAYTITFAPKQETPAAPQGEEAPSQAETSSQDPLDLLKAAAPSQTARRIAEFALDVMSDRVFHEELREPCRSEWRRVPREQLAIIIIVMVVFALRLLRTVANLPTFPRPSVATTDIRSHAPGTEIGELRSATRTTPAPDPMSHADLPPGDSQFHAGPSFFRYRQAQWVKIYTLAGNQVVPSAWPFRKALPGLPGDTHASFLLEDVHAWLINTRLPTEDPAHWEPLPWKPRVVVHHNGVLAQPDDNLDRFGLRVTLLASAPAAPPTATPATTPSPEAP